MTSPMLSPYPEEENVSPSLSACCTASNENSAYGVFSPASAASIGVSTPKRSHCGPACTGHSLRSSWYTGYGSRISPTPTDLSKAAKGSDSSTWSGSRTSVTPPSCHGEGHLSNL